jgi:hypothetical protein
MSKKYQIPVVSLIREDGAGGFDTTVYPDIEALLADHNKAEYGKVSDEDRKSILNGDDEYENGMVSKGEIIVEISDDGKAKLSKSFHFHGGQ